jgi:RecA-family ATPase
MTPLPIQRAAQLPTQGAQTQWLIQDLWSDQAVGILGGEPKCCKSFLALDIALSVASGTDCLRRYPVKRKGTVLLFPAEDSLAIVRKRLEGIAAAAGITLEPLPIEVITAPTLRLDMEQDRLRLAETVKNLHPTLLILDPLIRLHRIDENDATQIAGLLSFLRELQRNHGVAVLLVHHARKDSRGSRPGQALRGSSELHGWGDSNLYMRRHKNQLTLWTEHRAAPSLDPIPMELEQNGEALALSIQQKTIEKEETKNPTKTQKILQALEEQDQPVTLHRLREHCSMRTATVSELLKQLIEKGDVHHSPSGYRINPLTRFPPIGTQGKGNGKH